jgi:cell wall-associated NlpC family hydrolase
MVLAVMFAELMAGGILLTSAVTGRSIREAVQGNLEPKGKEGSPTGVEGTAEAPGTLKGSPYIKGKSGNVLAHAVTQLGVPYQWGGEAERVAFDCSGLVQWAAKKAGISLPRTAQEQFNATERVPVNRVEKGDLVFFSNGSEISHVGIVAGNGVMLDAPHTGAKVSYANFPMQIGAKWGGDTVAGFGKL